MLFFCCRSKPCETIWQSKGSFPSSTETTFVYPVTQEINFEEKLLEANCLIEKVKEALKDIGKGIIKIPDQKKGSTESESTKPSRARCVEVACSFHGQCLVKSTDEDEELTDDERMEKKEEVVQETKSEKLKDTAKKEKGIVDDQVKEKTPLTTAATKMVGKEIKETENVNEQKEVITIKPIGENIEEYDEMVDGLTESLDVLQTKLNTISELSETDVELKEEKTVELKDKDSTEKGRRVERACSPIGFPEAAPAEVTKANSAVLTPKKLHSNGEVPPSAVSSDIKWIFTPTVDEKHTGGLSPYQRSQTSEINIRENPSKELEKTDKVRLKSGGGKNNGSPGRKGKRSKTVEKPKSENELKKDRSPRMSRTSDKRKSENELKKRDQSRSMTKMGADSKNTVETENESRGEVANHEQLLKALRSDTSRSCSGMASGSEQTSAFSVGKEASASEVSSKSSAKAAKLSIQLMPPVTIRSGLVMQKTLHLCIKGTGSVSNDMPVKSNVGYHEINADDAFSKSEEALSKGRRRCPEDCATPDTGYCKAEEVVKSEVKKPLQELIPKEEKAVLDESTLLLYRSFQILEKEKYVKRGSQVSLATLTQSVARNIQNIESKSEKRPFPIESKTGGSLLQLPACSSTVIRTERNPWEIGFYKTRGTQCNEDVLKRAASWRPEESWTAIRGRTSEVSWASGVSKEERKKSPPIHSGDEHKVIVIKPESKHEPVHSLPTLNGEEQKVTVTKEEFQRSVADGLKIITAAPHTAQAVPRGISRPAEIQDSTLSREELERAVVSLEAEEDFDAYEDDDEEMISNIDLRTKSAEAIATREKPAPAEKPVKIEKPTKIEKPAGDEKPEKIDKSAKIFTPMVADDGLPKVDARGSGGPDLFDEAAYIGAKSISQVSSPASTGPSSTPAFSLKSASTSESGSSEEPVRENKAIRISVEQILDVLHEPKAVSVTDSRDTFETLPPSNLSDQTVEVVSVDKKSHSSRGTIEKSEEKVDVEVKSKTLKSADVCSSSSSSSVYSNHVHGSSSSSQTSAPSRLKFERAQVGTKRRYSLDEPRKEIESQRDDVSGSVESKQRTGKVVEEPKQKRKSDEIKEKTPTDKVEEAKKLEKMHEGEPKEEGEASESTGKAETTDENIQVFLGSSSSESVSSSSGSYRSEGENDTVAEYFIKGLTGTSQEKLEKLRSNPSFPSKDFGSWSKTFLRTIHEHDSNKRSSYQKQRKESGKVRLPRGSDSVTRSSADKRSEDTLKIKRFKEIRDMKPDQTESGDEKTSDQVVMTVLEEKVIAGEGDDPFKKFTKKQLPFYRRMLGRLMDRKMPMRVVHSHENSVDDSWSEGEIKCKSAFSIGEVIPRRRVVEDKKKCGRGGHRHVKKQVNEVAWKELADKSFRVSKERTQFNENISRYLQKLSSMTLDDSSTSTQSVGSNRK